MKKYTPIVILGSLISITTSFYFYLVFLSFIVLITLPLSIFLFSNNKTTLNKISLILSILAFLRLIYLFVTINLASFNASRKIVEFYIPKNYNGWVKIYNKIPDAPPIEIISQDNRERMIFKIPNSGILETSFNMDTLPAHVAKYFWYDDTLELNYPFTNDEVKNKIYCSGGNEKRSYFYVFNHKKMTPEDSVAILKCYPGHH